MQGAWNSSIIFYKWKDQFLEGGRKGLEGKDSDKSLIKEVENLKSIIDVG